MHWGSFWLGVAAAFGISGLAGLLAAAFIRAGKGPELTPTGDKESA